MPIVNKAILKAYFQTGSTPTEAQFGNLIDSMVNVSDDSEILGLSEFDPTRSYLTGAAVIFSNDLYVALTNVSPGTFNPVEWQQIGNNIVDSVNGQIGAVQLDAVDIPYDNTTSGLTATDAQAAVDELAALPSSLWDSGAGSGSLIPAGSTNTAIGTNAIATGAATDADGENSHAEGFKSLAHGAKSHAEGGSTEANGENSHAEGADTVADGISSHAEGSFTQAQGDFSHAEGAGTIASNDNSHAEGENTVASGYTAHAEGIDTEATGDGSHAQGNSSVADGDFSHAEGNGTLASGESSHAEGSSTQATNTSAHARGTNTVAGGKNSSAMGSVTLASADNSFAGGSGISPGKEVLSLGESSFNYSKNSASQTAGNGAQAESSAILGGQDHHIVDTSPNSAILGGVGNTVSGNTDRAVILGGTGITADKDDYVFLQNLEIQDGDAIFNQDATLQPNFGDRSLIDKAYVDSQIGANNELSEVLAVGNTTGGNDIEFGTDLAKFESNGTIFSGLGILTVQNTNNLFLRSSSGTVIINSQGAVASVRGGGLEIANAAGSLNGGFDPSALTGNQTYTLPDQTGTIALTSDIVAAQDLQDVTDQGTTTDNDIEITDTLKGIILTAPDSTRYRVTVKNNGQLETTAI
jgi:hypothetical protein